MELISISDLVKKYASQYGLDSNLVSAIIVTESAGNPWAMRFEPGWRYFTFVREWADQLHITYETEKMCQATSWGLMQVMGSVARELGFQEELCQLVDPELAVEFGCKKLKKLFERYGSGPSGEDDVIAAYNAGSAIKTIGGMYVNQVYCDKVHFNLLPLRALK